MFYFWKNWTALRLDSSQCGAAAADNLEEAAIDESSPANITWASYDVDQATREKVENIQASINGERCAQGQQPIRIKHLEQAGDADSRKRGESSGYLTEGVRGGGRGFGKGARRKAQLLPGHSAHVRRRMLNRSKHGR